MEDGPRDATDTTRRLKDSNGAHSACDPPPRGASTQARRYGTASEDEAGAQDGVGNSNPVNTHMNAEETEGGGVASASCWYLLFSDILTLSDYE